MNAEVQVLRRAVYGALTASLCLLVRPRRRRRFRLAVLKLDRLGDAVLSLGAVRRLMAEFGEKETLLIVSTIARPLFQREFPQATLLVLPAFCERFWPDLLICLIRHAAKLRAISAETLVCLRHQHSDYLHAVALLLEAERCHAARWQHGSERTSLAFPRCRYSLYPDAAQGACLEIEAHRRVVASTIGVDIALEEVLPSLSSDPPGGGGGLLICPGAGDPIREYPAPLLLRAVSLFIEKRQGMEVAVCLPLGAERQIWKDSLSKGPQGRIRWLLPESFEALAAAIANADVVLAPDSAPAHLATALDKPGVFLLGGGHFGMFAPWGKSGRQVWLRHEMDCYHCRWNCRQPEPYCVTRIQPEAVAQALLEVVGGCPDS
jgi:ADP-heptose:LPS heptosyltransferase